SVPDTGRVERINPSTKMGVDSLDQLPPELLVNIFSQLPLESLISLQRVCKGFKAIIVSDRRFKVLAYNRSLVIAKKRFKEEPITQTNALGKPKAAIRYFKEQIELDESTTLLKLNVESERLKRAQEIYDDQICNQSGCCKFMVAISIVLCCPLISIGLA